MIFRQKRESSKGDSGKCTYSYGREDKREGMKKALGRGEGVRGKAEGGEREREEGKRNG